MTSQINIGKLVSKEIFSLEKDGVEKLWMVSGFDDEKEDISWNNIYDYDYLLQTGEYVPYFKSGDKVHAISHYGKICEVLFLEDLHQKMQEEGFVWKY